MVQIIPAILATTEEEYSQKLKKIDDSGVFEGGWLQIDLMDAKFVKNESIQSDVISKYPTDLKIEAQLMVEYPENWIDGLVKIKVDRIIFPIEDTEGIKERIEHIKNHGIAVGLSINPETSTEEVKPFLSMVDSVLVMSVNPGFGGQEFIPEVLKKIREIKDGVLDVLVGVDGGISSENAKLVVDAGADYLVVGSHLLEGNIDENLEIIWEKIHSS